MPHLTINKIGARGTKIISKKVAHFPKLLGTVFWDYLEQYTTLLENVCMLNFTDHVHR